MAEVYYQSENVTLWLGDCRDTLDKLPRAGADLLLTDPPYGVKWQSGWRKDSFGAMAGDDGSIDWPNVLGHLARRALKPHRHVYVFGYTPEQLAEPLDLGGPCELVWDKLAIGMGDLSQPYGPAHERITFGTYHRGDLAQRKAGRGNLSARLRQGSVLRVKRPSAGGVRHPSEKPVRLLRQLIESSTVLGDTVFDPCAGTGASGVAAIVSGRRALLIETDPKWAQLAATRLKAAEHACAALDSL